ncbi:PAPA-1-like conserved region-domain-containing protein [Aspergillus varians]
MSLRRSLRARAGRDDPPSIESNTSTRSTRQSRLIPPLPSVTVVRTPSESPESARKSIHITVRMPSNKLREATSGNSRSAASRRSHNVFTDNPIVSGPRTSRSKRRLVEVDTSEEEEDLEDQEEDEVDDEDAPGEDEEDEDADADADGDVDMDDTPPQPPVSRRNAKATVNPAPIRKPAKIVETKETELDEEDEEEDEEELSEPDSDADGEPDDQEEGVTITLNEGEEPEDDEEDDEDLDDSEDGTPSAADISKLTKRQRGNLGNDFLQLPMEPQIKKHLTAEERAMRRAEMARRRKNLSEKRNEEEKMDTINRLLRKQAPKRRGRIPAAEAAENAATDQETMVEYDPIDSTMVRWVSGRDGSRVAVPEEWIGTPMGHIFGGTPRKLVEET